MTERLLLHGLPVALTAGALPPSLRAPLRALFTADLRPDGPPALTLALARAPAAAPLPAAATFHFGAVRGCAAGEALWLSDGQATARILPRQGLIEATLGPGALAGGARVVHVLLFIALSVALRRWGLYHLHAAALVRPDGGCVLLAGEAGSGKTTAALALVRAGWSYLGDDACWLRRAADGGAEVLAVARPFHVGPGTAALFPWVTAHLRRDAPPRAGKAPLCPRAAFGAHRALSAARPDLLLLPEVHPAAPTGLHRLEEAAAFSRLLRAGALMLLAGAPRRRAHFALLRDLFAQTAHRALHLGADLGPDPLRLARLLTPRGPGAGAAGPRRGSTLRASPGNTQPDEVTP